MPTYEYVVILPDGSEGEVFTQLQSFDEEPLTRHPVDGGRCGASFLCPARKRKAGAPNRT